MHVWAFQSPNELVAGWICLQPRPGFSVVCVLLSPGILFQPPRPACSTPSTTVTATTLDSVDGPPASVTSAPLGFPHCAPPAHFLGPPFTVVVTGCLARDKEVPFHISYLSWLWFHVIVMNALIRHLSLAFPPTRTSLCTLGMPRRTVAQIPSWVT
jgi:hypothetical protein